MYVMTTSSSASAGAVQSGERSSAEAFARTVDWLVAIFLGLAGLVFAVGGYFLFLAADRTRIAELVADGTIQSAELTNAELTSVVHALVWYGGLGLAVMGVVLVVAGVAFLAVRTRSRRNRETGRDATTNAIVGAVVTVVTSFVPFSPVLGGVAAGYLQGSDGRTGVRVGAIAGLIASVPLAILFAFVIGGFAIVTAELSLGFVAVVGGFAMVFALAVAVFVLVALSAVGGYVGASLAGGDDDVTPEVPA